MNGPVREEVLRRARIRTAHTNGLQHRILTFNEGSRDLVFVPGITSPAETAEFLVDALPEFTVHVPDLRGRGRSGRAAPGGYTMEHYRQDLAGVIAQLDLTDPVVVGHSLGARIAAAWSLVDGGGSAPVVLVDPPMSGPGRPYPMSAESFARQLAQARTGTDPAAIREHFPGWPERELQLRAEVLAECDETAVLETHRTFEAEHFLPTWDRLHGRVSLMYGAESPVVRPADVTELKRRKPEIPVVAVADAGHMVPWDNRTGFVEALRPLIINDADPIQSQERKTP